MGKETRKGIPSWLDRKKGNQDKLPPHEHQKSLDDVNSLRRFTGIADGKGRLQFASQAPGKELGYAEDDILRRPFWEAAWFAQSSESQRVIREAILGAAAGKTVRCQVEAFARDGTSFPVTFNVSPLRGENAEAVSIVAEAESTIEGREGKDARELRKARGDLKEAMAQIEALTQENTRLLEEAEARKMDFIEGAVDGIAILQDGVIACINSRLADMWGYGRDELIGSSFIELVTPESRQLVWESYQRRSSGEPVQPIYEIMGLAKDGATFPVELNAEALEYKGKPTDMIILKDLRERNKAEKGQLEAERRYRAIFDNPLHMIYVHDEQGRFVDANGFALERLGYTQDDIGKVFFQDIIHQDDLPAVFEAMQEVITKGRMERTIEIRLFSKSREMFWIDCFSLILEQDGEHFTAMGIARDITDRKHTEDEIQREKAFTESVLTSIPDMVLTLNPEGKIGYANEAFLQFTRQEAEQVVGAHLIELAVEASLLPPKSIEMISQRLKEWQETGRPIANVELEMLNSKGESIAASYSTSGITGPGGENWGEVIVLRDITERKHTEEELQHSEERLKELVEKLKLAQEELSTPVVQVWDRILVLPLIGVIDSTRAQKIADVLLRRIVDTQAEMVILDVTGIASMDTQVTSRLLRTIQSASLLGTQCVITGIMPGAAQGIVRLGMDMSSLVTRRDMQEGLRWALNMMGYELTSRH